jgi:hypothetical protein
MISYGIILLLVALLFAVIARMISKGRTDLIHDYHQQRVKDKAGYAKEFGKAMWILAAAPALSGIIGMLGESGWVVTASLGVLFAGFAVGIVAILRVQKKYNDGLF